MNVIYPSGAPAALCPGTWTSRDPPSAHSAACFYVYSCLQSRPCPHIDFRLGIVCSLLGARLTVETIWTWHSWRTGLLTSPARSASLFHDFAWTRLTLENNTDVGLLLLTTKIFSSPIILIYNINIKSGCRNRQEN